MKKIFLSFILFGILFSCQQPDELSPEIKTKIISAVKARLKAYQRAVKLNGLTAEFEYLDNSEDFFWTPPGYSQALSYDSLGSILRLNADYYTKITNVYDTINVVPLSRTLASYSGTIRSTTIDTLGNRSAFLLVETGVVIKRKKKWMLLNGQTSVIVN